MKSKKTLVIVLIVAGAGLILLISCPCIPLILMPFVNRAITAVRIAATESTTKNVCAGLEAFKADWSVYPPSSATTGGARENGAENLRYYLAGPEGNGWGLSANGAVPFGDRKQLSYGPYWRANPESPSAAGLVVPDAFKPAKPILYFRFDRDRDPPYDVRDNPVGTSYAKGFASQEQFELLVRPKDASGNRKWVREDYLLISPGVDRYYGFVVEDKATGEVRLARPEEVEAGEATCDDITNFKH